MTRAATYRDADAMRGVLRRIHDAVTRQWNIMEVCGGQTFTLSRYRLEELLPEKITMIHGPGCPVCVTPVETIDRAIDIAMHPDVTFCSFGDMLRVPGSEASLLQAKARGADVRILYSPLEALKMAMDRPDRQIVFFAIGFETTAPIYALLAQKAVGMGIGNFSLLTSLFTVPAAVEAIKLDDQCRVDALLAAGHVCAITGTAEYESLSRELGIPIVITGFEPVDMLYGISKAVDALESSRIGVVNAYGRAVRAEGNRAAKKSIDEVFEHYDARWRGIGVIKHSGLTLRRKFEHLDATRRFKFSHTSSHECNGCIAAKIMKGLSLPADCPHFATDCTPQSPVGAPMVSSEGVCAAHYKYNRFQP